MSTDLAAALANVDLGEFEGAPVLGTAIEIPNAGGGALHAALAIDPLILHKGQRVMVLLECEMVKPSFPPVKNSAGVTRVHTLKTIAASIVDGDVFKEALAAQTDKIQRAKDAASGQTRIDDAVALQAEHDDGGHAAGLRENCPSCVEEKAAVEAEAG